MNNKKRYDGGGEIQAKIDKFTKLMNDSRSTEDEISRYKVGIEKLKAMLPSGAEKPAEKVAEKVAEKKTAEKKPAEKKSTEKKPAEKVAEKKSAEAPKKKGVQVLSSKRVMIDGEEVGMDSKEFCDYLLGEFRARREKAEENKTKKKKTTSVMSKVTSNIEKGITTAIKNSIKDNRVAINKDPKVFIGKVQKLETATKNFLDNLKEVLGSEFDAKEVTSTTNAIHSMIEELKKKYADK
jgi:hypothetical protein